VPSNIAKAYCY